MKYSHFMKILIVFCMLTFSCGSFEGNFAYKKFNEDTFKKYRSTAEFHVDERIRWAYIFKEITSKLSVAIIIQKKEISWVDVYTRKDSVSPEKRAVYGEIKDFPEGRYRLLIMSLKKRKILDTSEFVIYNE